MPGGDLQGGDGSLLDQDDSGLVLAGGLADLGQQSVDDQGARPRDSSSMSRMSDRVAHGDRASTQHLPLAAG